MHLLLCLSSALQQDLISSTERAALHSYLAQGQLELVAEVVAGLNTRDVAERPLARTFSAWTCMVCFDIQESIGWACPDQHRFCSECMRHHVDSVTFPRCPQVGCEYELNEDDFKFLIVPEDRIEAFRRARLTGAIDTLAEGEEHIMRCPRPECGNVVILPPNKGRFRFDCECGAVAFCTQCRQAPYHYHAECSRVQTLRERWLAWNEADARRAEALRVAVRAHAELEADEQWKALNCRLCPKCSRPVSKVDGCDAMVCGRSYHGGDQQPGCGTSFDFSRAKRYTAVVTRRRVIPEKGAKLRERAKNSFHPFAQCSLCHKRGIAGLRFRCIHCESFNSCARCEPKLGDSHPSDHVFEVMVESSFTWTHLPTGTHVRFVRRDDRLPQSWLRTRLPDRVAARSSVISLEGKRGAVVQRWNGPPHGYRIRLDGSTIHVDLPAEHVEPVVADVLQARRLAELAKQEKRKSVPQRFLAPVPTPPPTPLFAPSADEVLAIESAPERRRPVRTQRSSRPRVWT